MKSPNEKKTKKKKSKLREASSRLKGLLHARSRGKEAPLQLSELKEHSEATRTGEMLRSSRSAQYLVEKGTNGEKEGHDCEAYGGSVSDERFLRVSECKEEPFDRNGSSSDGMSESAESLQNSLHIGKECIAFLDGDGDDYIGEWGKGKRHGFGVLSYSNGDTYEGMWANGKRHGIGNYTSAISGHMYEGDWKDGEMHGKGKLSYSNGEEYNGEWSVGMMHGHGKFIFESGAYYEGDWVEDLKQGRGVSVMANGNVI